MSNLNTGGDSGYNNSCFHISTTTGGGSTITVTFASVSYSALVIDEFSGVGVLDLNDTPTTGYGTTATSNSITTTQNGDLVLGWCGLQAGGAASLTMGSGYTLGAGNANQMLNGYQIKASAGSINATCGISTTYGWGAHIIAFKHQ
jgi:hypothetical protein